MNSMLAILPAALILNLPQIAIAAVGLVLIHIKLKRPHPRVHLYGTIGLAFLLAHGLLGVAISLSMPYARRSYEPAAFAKWITVTNLASLGVLSASLVLLLVALLADREAAKSLRVAA